MITWHRCYKICLSVDQCFEDAVFLTNGCKQTTCEELNLKHQALAVCFTTKAFYNLVQQKIPMPAAAHTQVV